MGQAKARGTKEDRVKVALAKKELEAPTMPPTTRKVTASGLSLLSLLVNDRDRIDESEDVRCPKCRLADKVGRRWSGDEELTYLYCHRCNRTVGPVERA